MGKYTNLLEEKIITIYSEDAYIEELKRVVGEFRSFDEALDSFIVERGYGGNIDNIDEKVTFISDKCKIAGVPVPRNLKKWYTEHKRIERTSAVPFHLCFAFELSVDEVNDFLRRICLSKGFDCHSIEEVVYFYAFKNGLKFDIVQDILKKVPKIRPEKLSYDELIYTDLIVEEIDDIDSVEELVLYLNENAEKFGYNNASAYESIKTIWEQLSGKNGTEGDAVRERKKMYISFDKEKEAQEHYENEIGRKERKRIDDSMWEIYLQILGLAGSYSADFYKNRSLKTMLNGNELLHPLAEDSFPDRDGLTKILNGEHVSYERVRKLLILLKFYQYYVKKALEKCSYEVPEDEAGRCIAKINDELNASNYPMLYPGNPYDFIILMSICTTTPLLTFRGYMQELFFESMDMNSFYGTEE